MLYVCTQRKQPVRSRNTKDETKNGNDKQKKPEKLERAKESKDVEDEVEKHARTVQSLKKGFRQDKEKSIAREIV